VFVLNARLLESIERYEHNIERDDQERDQHADEERFQMRLGFLGDIGNDACQPRQEHQGGPNDWDETKAERNTRKWQRFS